MNHIRERRREREREKKVVPIPITVPYSAFLSFAETAGGQRKMRARKRKKTKEREEMRREECFLDGRAMLSGRESWRGRRRASGFIFRVGPIVPRNSPKRATRHH
jgi:hypothetical protein